MYAGLLIMSISIIRLCDPLTGVEMQECYLMAEMLVFAIDPKESTLVDFRHSGRRIESQPYQQDGSSMDFPYNGHTEHQVCQKKEEVNQSDTEPLLLQQRCPRFKQSECALPCQRKKGHPVRCVLRFVHGTTPSRLLQLCATACLWARYISL